MEYFWFKFDKSGGWAKTMWFVLMITGLPFGFLAYFYAVYLPQTRPVTDEEKSQPQRRVS